jgi:5-methylcytosine-specific restriction endonuclease McrA
VNSPEYNRDYYLKNRESIVAKRKARRETPEFKARMREYQQKYNAANPHKTREGARRRRARIRKVETRPYSESQVLELYGLVCHICSQQIDLDAPRKQGDGTDWHMGLHIDHIIPISAGGGDTLENVRPAHAICNLRKGPIQLVTQRRELT